MSDKRSNPKATDREEEFHRERIHTLGMLAGGVAHDFNNLLTGILGHISYLRRILPRTGSHLESVCAIEEGARKASGLTQQILNYSKLDCSEELAEVDLCDLVCRTCRLLKGAILPRYSLSFDVAKQAVVVLANEAKLAQVIVNLVINSRDALDEGGKIEVSVRSVQHNDKTLAQLQVADNGHGMSTDVIKRIFEPYFSTKGSKGTGLGLFTVKAIVESLGGEIQINSDPGQGTNFSVYIPQAMPEQPLITKDSSGLSSCTGGERILIVDDELPVTQVLSLGLKHLGYQVEIAMSGAEAFEKYSKSFDLVILDMLMPSVSGEEVFAKLRDLNPQLKALLISGFTSEESIRGTLAQGALDFIQKPFTIEELSQKVRECLDK